MVRLSYSGYLLALVFILYGNISIAREEFFVSGASDTELSVESFPAQGNYLLIWLAPEYDFKPTHYTLAQALAEHSIEVWMSNIIESLYLPQSLKSLKQLDGQYVAELIEYAHQKTGKNILLVGDSYAAITVLRGIHQWQKRNPNQTYLNGSILFTPYTYAYIPSLGLQPEYMPVVSATNTPVMIFQATGSANSGQFETLKEKLQLNSKTVYSQYINNVMGLFYEETPTPEVQQHLQKLPVTIKKILPVLKRATVPSQALSVDTITVNDSGIDHYLKKYQGNTTANTIDLIDVHGQSFTKQSYKGQVTLINFWATWCPPCVEEIPSLNRFQEKMADLPVELISINYAEDSQTIIEFMNKIKVDFPVLLDKNGEFAKQWGVLTYPSTFVINKQGHIEYGVNAAIEWDAPELIKIIKSML